MLLCREYTSLTVRVYRVEYFSDIIMAHAGFYMYMNILNRDHVTSQWTTCREDGSPQQPHTSTHSDRVIMLPYKNLAWYNIGVSCGLTIVERCHDHPYPSAA